MPKYRPRDILMYHYVKEMPPYIGLVTVANDSTRNAWVRWWSVGRKSWDDRVGPHSYNDPNTTLIGVLPVWAETDEEFGSDLPPLTRRVAEGSLSS